jgi:Domain of unknown function (DUF4062)
MTGIIERRLEVFIGATRRDLSKARQKVQEAVLEAGHFPCGMELWNSDTVPTRETIRRHLTQCDVHILLVGARYGEYIDPAADKPISFTEWEFQEAKGLKKPIIVFLLDDDCFKTARLRQTKDDASEKARTEALNRFRTELTSFQFSRKFTEDSEGIEKLGRLCANSLNELINSGRLSEDAGWIRINSEDARRTRDIRRNKFLSRVIERLRQFQKLTDRVLEQRTEKEEAAKFFWEDMAGRVRRRGYRNLFFESGSSIAYVSQEFEDHGLGGPEDAKKWRVKTNNVETLLQLLLHTDLNIQPFPPSAPNPEDKYGAIFPPEFSDLKEPPPLAPRGLYTPAECDKEMKSSESCEVAALRTKLKELADRVLILAATSGLDLAHADLNFRGPHVGSHSNMLFKRAIMTSGFPVVLFLDSKKFGSKFVEGKCYPVFGPDYTWERARAELPLAICTAWDLADVGGNDLAGRIGSDMGALRNLGFEPKYACKSLSASGRVVIAANELFRRCLPAT